MSNLRHIRPAGLANAPTYTHVVGARGAETLYIAGQVAMDASGKTVGVGDLAAQTEQVMQNLQTALHAAGATFRDVVKITTFVVAYTPEQRAKIIAYSIASLVIVLLVVFAIYLLVHREALQRAIRRH